MLYISMYDWMKGEMRWMLFTTLSRRAALFCFTVHTIIFLTLSVG
jgi:hypothetical protein